MRGSFCDLTFSFVGSFFWLLLFSAFHTSGDWSAVSILDYDPEEDGDEATCNCLKIDGDLDSLCGPDCANRSAFGSFLFYRSSLTSFRSFLVVMLSICLFFRKRRWACCPCINEGTRMLSELNYHWTDRSANQSETNRQVGVGRCQDETTIFVFACVWFCVLFCFMMFVCVTRLVSKISNVVLTPVLLVMIATIGSFNACNLLNSLSKEYGWTTTISNREKHLLSLRIRPSFSLLSSTFSARCYSGSLLGRLFPLSSLNLLNNFFVPHILVCVVCWWFSFCFFPAQLLGPTKGKRLGSIRWSRSCWRTVYHWLHWRGSYVFLMLLMLNESSESAKLAVPPLHCLILDLFFFLFLLFLSIAVQILPSAEVDRRLLEDYTENRNFYTMGLTSSLSIDATRKANCARFVNHSCDPNAEIQKW